MESQGAVATDRSSLKMHKILKLTPLDGQSHETLLFSLQTLLRGSTTRQP